MFLILDGSGGYRPQSDGTQKRESKRRIAAVLIGDFAKVSHFYRNSKSFTACLEV